MYTKCPSRKLHTCSCSWGYILGDIYIEMMHASMYGCTDACTYVLHRRQKIMNKLMRPFVRYISILTMYVSTIGIYRQRVCMCVCVRIYGRRKIYVTTSK